MVYFSCSYEPLIRVAAHNLSFKMLYGELDVALQLHKVAKMNNSKNSIKNTNSSVTNKYVYIGYMVN